MLGLALLASIVGVAVNQVRPDGISLRASEEEVSGIGLIQGGTIGLEEARDVSLILGIWVPGAALACNILLGIFSLGLAFNLLRGLDIDCGCFRLSLEGAPRDSMLVYLLRDACFLGLGVYLLSQQSLEKRRLFSRVFPKSDCAS